MTNVFGFDTYTLKARIAPGLLALLPLVAVAIAWFPQVVSLPGIAAMGLGIIAGGVVLSSQIRRDGQRLQERLFRKWGGAPTTQVLRHRDATFASNDKARYHTILQALVSGIQMPSPEAEQAHHASADVVYETATAWLREQTRDSSKFPVVSSENANYGFHRNLCALRSTGLIAASIGILGAASHLALNQAPTALPALLISIVCALVWWRNAQERHVREAGFAYAVGLVRAVDALKTSRGP